MLKKGVLGTGQVNKWGSLLRHIPVLAIYVSAPPRGSTHLFLLRGPGRGVLFTVQQNTTRITVHEENNTYFTFHDENKLLLMFESTRDLGMGFTDNDIQWYILLNTG